MAHAEPTPGTGGRGKRLAATIAVVLAIGTALGVVLLRPTGEVRPDASVLTSFKEVHAAEVDTITDQACSGTTEGGLTCRLVGFRLLAGPDEGEVVELELIADNLRVTGLEPGDEVLMGFQPDAPPELRYAYLDPDRRTVLVYLAFLFGAAVILLGGLRGLAALVGLGATFVVLLAFIVPAILDGRSPLAVALVGSSAIAFLALYLSHGFTTRTTVALLGTLGGLASVALLAVVFMAFADITGFGTEESFIVQALGGQIDLRGVVLGGIVIGALGAIDDITVTQAAAVWELRASGIRDDRLLRAGMRIGRDHVSSTVNTLALAYAGASMPLLILFVLSEQSFGTVANSEVLAAEIVRTLVGSIGLIASVPITTWLAVRISGPTRGGPAPATEDETDDDDSPPDELELPRRRRDAIF
jgi:uncharacterized membrane protein